MATFVPAVNTAEVVVAGSWAGQNVLTTYAMKYASELTVALLTALASEFISQWITWLKVLFVDAWNLISAKATDLTTETAPSVIEFPASATHGQQAITSTPANAALVISELTEHRGRSYRGRIYHMGIPQNVAANAVTVTGTYQASVLTEYAEFISAIETAQGCVHSIVSRYHDGAPRAEAIVTPITGYLVNPDFDSQRRRLKGRGL